ncbi:MAG: peptidoglycan-binding protein, partial [Acidimicrobiia bacterium]|nr:peptidoglycan-binding protein [Acidimicrobiia bacterium]
MVLTAIATSIVLSLGAQATSQVPAPTVSAATAAASAGSTSNGTSVLPVLGDSSDDVVRLQQAMVARGFTLKGGVDGEFSTRTQTTLRNMQKAVGLRVTGIVDEPTARFLGLIVVQRLTPTTLPKAGDQ